METQDGTEASAVTFSHIYAEKLDRGSSLAELKQMHQVLAL